MSDIAAYPKVFFLQGALLVNLRRMREESASNTSEDGFDLRGRQSTVPPTLSFLPVRCTQAIQHLRPVVAPVAHGAISGVICLHKANRRPEADGCRAVRGLLLSK